MSLNDLLAGGAKTIKLDSIGETITGTILSVNTKQVTAFGSGAPEFWDDGNPKMQIVITIKSDDLEDGEGSFYAKAWGTDKAALSAAVAMSGLTADQALAPGNEITITHTELRPHKTPGFNPSKIYEFQIRPKAPTSVVNALADTPTPSAPAPSAPAPAPVPAAPSAPATPPPAANPAGIPELIKAGLSNEQIASSLGVEASIVAIVRANQSGDEAPF